MKKLLWLVGLPVLAGSLGLAVASAAPVPSFAGTKAYPVGRIPEAIAIGDLNDDGKPDLATSNYGADSASVLLNSGDGTFQPKVDYGTARSPTSVAIGDLNGDGKLDLATADIVSLASVFLNRGDGSFEPRRDYPTGWGPYAMAIGDLNGDGRLDLATGNYGNTVSVLVNRGDGSFQPEVDYATARSPSRSRSATSTATPSWTL